MPKIGIMGGMGPEADINFTTLLFEQMQAEGTGDIDIIKVSAPAYIPERPPAILDPNRNESPVEAMVAMAVALHDLGADTIVIPCVTATHFQDEVVKRLKQKGIHTPILSMYDAIEEALPEHVRDGTKAVTFLGTRGTHASGKLRDHLLSKGYRVVEPNDKQQELVQEAIWQIKNSGVDNSVPAKTLLDVKKSIGAGVTVLACTELGLVMEEDGSTVVDASKALATHAVRTSLDLDPNLVPNNQREVRRCQQLSPTTIGILGIPDPVLANAFERQMRFFTDAKGDEAHVPIVTISQNMPDASAEQMCNAMTQAAQKLKELGVTIIVIPSAGDQPEQTEAIKLAKKTIEKMGLTIIPQKDKLPQLAKETVQNAGGKPLHRTLPDDGKTVRPILPPPTHTRSSGGLNRNKPTVET